MAPQPLHRVKRLQQWRISAKALKERPALAATVMRIVGTWSEIESDVFALTALFLKADFQIVAKMLLAITSTEGRNAVIRAAAEHALPTDEFHIFRAISALARSCHDRRNEFVHDLWGYSDDLPDALLLFPQSHVAERMADVDAYYRKHDPLKTGWPVAIGAIVSGDPEWPTIDSKEVDVYRDADLAAELDRFERVLRHVKDFRKAMSHEAKRTERFRELQAMLQTSQSQQTLPSGSDP